MNVSRACAKGATFPRILERRVEPAQGPTNVPAAPLRQPMGGLLRFELRTLLRRKDKRNVEFRGAARRRELPIAHP